MQIISDLIRRLSRDRVHTWIGHGLQGVAFTLPFSILAEASGTLWVHLLGLAFTVGAFFHRELEDLVIPGLEIGWRHAWTKFRRDGLMDFISPYGASILTIILTGLIRTLLG